MEPPVTRKRRVLPRDCTLLPLGDGQLAVSPGHAVFCRVPAEEADQMRLVMAHASPLSVLSRDMRNNLARHGFFDPPRTIKPDLSTVQLQLTNRCNLACAYCCTNSGHARHEEVTYEQMLQVARQIPKAMGEHTHVALLGGEVLMVPWVTDLASEILELGLGLTIFTNGVLLAMDLIAEKIAALIHRGAEVRVSLAGPTAETCDMLSGGSRFDQALLGIHKLAALEAGVTVDLMFVPQQIDAMIANMGALFQQLPVNTRIALGVLYLGGRERGAHLFASRALLEAALDRLAFETGVAVDAPPVSPVAYRRDGCACALGKHLHIRSDGALFNCFKMEEQVGHLNNPGFAAAAEYMRCHQDRVSSLLSCAECPLAALCGGGCRSENILYTGKPDRPLCGPWRVRVLGELLAEDRVSAVEWPIAHLIEECKARGIETPDDVRPLRPSRHLVDV
jgi:radical SAM protein with 4Fe4S-binding SPASM domain